MPLERRNTNSGHFGLDENETPLYINTNSPFCVCLAGLQGAGKSHTVCTLIENWMQPFPEPIGMEAVKLTMPMAGLVFHYDQMESNVCESAGLSKFAPVVR